jgi:hypothetical protein
VCVTPIVTSHSDFGNAGVHQAVLCFSDFSSVQACNSVDGS